MLYLYRKCLQMAKEYRYISLITQHAWMFLGSFEKLRMYLSAYDIINMAHLGARAFDEISGEVVQTTSFVINKTHIPEYQGTYVRLLDGLTQTEKRIYFVWKRKIFSQGRKLRKKFQGKPIAYRSKCAMLDAFK